MYCLFVYLTDKSGHLTPLDQVVKLQTFQGCWTPTLTVTQIINLDMHTINSSNPFTEEVMIHGYIL